MPSVEADMWVRVKDGDFGEQACDPLQEAVPSPPAPLAAAANLTQPETEYSLPERSKAPLVTGNGVVLEVSSHHRLQPFRRLRQRIMPPAPQLGMDLLQLRGHPFADRDADYRETARRPVCPPDVGETEKVEGLRTSFTTRFPSFGGKAPEFDQARFLRVELQSESRHAFLQFPQHSHRIFSVLEPQDGIIGVADDDDIAGRLLPPPLVTVTY